jgi:plastocyanin
MTIEALQQQLMLATHGLHISQSLIRNGTSTFHNEWSLANNATEESLRQIGVQAGEIKLDTGDIQRYAMADLVGQAIAGTGESIVRMTRAFSDQRNYDGAAEVLRMAGAVANLAFFAKDVFGIVNKFSNWAGPIGSIIGELFGIGVAILEGYSESAKPVADVLKEVLAEHQGKENLDQLEGVLDALALSAANLRGRTANSLTWDQANAIGKLTGSDEIIRLGAAESYLWREQRSEIWPEVFEVYVLARSMMIQNIVAALRTLSVFDDQGRPTADLLEAGEVIKELCKQCQSFLHKFSTILVNHGTRWFVGTNDRIYETKNGKDTAIGTYDTKAKRLVVAGGVDRIFFLGFNDTIYTTQGGEGRQLAGSGYSDLSVTLATTRSYHVYAVANGALKYQYFAAPNDPVAPPKPPVDPDLKLAVKILRLSATSERLYFLDGDRALKLCVGQEVRSCSSPGAKLELLSANRSHLYVANPDLLFRKPIGEVELAETAWTTLDWRASLGLSAGAKMTDLFACDDGTLSVVIDQRMYQYVEEFDEHGARKPRWSVVDRNTAHHVVRTPVRGYELFDALQDVLFSLEDGIAKLAASKPPMLELSSAALARVRVFADRFEPAEVTIRRGGRVRWVWEDGNVNRVSSTAPAFTSPESATSFAFDFVAPGAVTFSGKGAKTFTGVIHVK